jgi:hypothetical protein
MLYTETDLNLKHSPVTKVLMSVDDYNQLVVERNRYDKSIFKILCFDSLTRTTSELAEYNGGKYTVYNENLFNEFYLKPMRTDKKLVKELQAFIKADYNMDHLKEFNIKFKCFRRRINISITKFIRKTKNGIKKHT